MSEQYPAAAVDRASGPLSIPKNHPNATVALGSGSGLGALVVWIVGLFEVSMPAEVGAVVAGLIAAVALVIGREGLKGAIRMVWTGER